MFQNKLLLVGAVPNGGIVKSEELFLRYAFPCGESRFWRKLITASDWQTLQEVIQGNVSVDCDLLSRCFPEAMVGMSGLATQTGGTLWEVVNVATYWRSWHQGETPVYRATVLELINNKLLQVKGCHQGDAVKVLNPYGVKIQRGDSVYVHCSCVIEKA